VNEFVFSFFNKGAYVNAKDENGKMPLHLTLKNNHDEIISTQFINQTEHNHTNIGYKKCCVAKT
jgi:ankyrin repeat protein